MVAAKPVLKESSDDESSDDDSSDESLDEVSSLLYMFFYIFCAT